MISLQADIENDQVLVEESESYRLLLTLQNSRMECLAEIELFPSEICGAEQAAVEQRWNY